MYPGFSAGIVSRVSPWSTTSPAASLSASADPSMLGSLQRAALSCLQRPTPGECFCIRFISVVGRCAELFFFFFVFRCFRPVLCSIYPCLTHSSLCCPVTLPSCCPLLTSPAPPHTSPTTLPICPSLDSSDLIQRSRLDQ